MAHSLITTIQTTNNWKYKMIETLTDIEINLIKTNLTVKSLSNRWQKRYVEFLNSHKEILDKISIFVIQNPEYENVKNVFQLILENRDLNTCQICGNKLKLSDSRYMYSTRFCKNAECLMKKQEFINETRRKNTFEKYGVHHTSALQSVIEKQKQTYNLLHPKQNKVIIQKERKPKKHYTFEFSEESLQSKREKQKSTCLAKYGVKNNLLTPELVEKRKINRFKFYYFNQIPKWKDYIVPQFSFDEYTGHTHNQIYSWKCVKCGTIFSSRIWKTHVCKEHEYMPRCLNCFPYHGSNGRISMSETAIYNFCKQYFTNIIHNDKKLIAPLELDIVIPELHLAIEFNGLFWHSYSFKDKNYHLMKTEMCENLGYRLIHIFEDEWNKDKEEIKFKLNSIFNNTFSYSIQNDEIVLDRCWYSKNTEINGFYLAEITEPTLLQNNCYNCGKLIYKRNEETK